MSTDQFAALRRGFTIEDKRPEREYFIVVCKACKARWSLKTTTGGVNGANVLHLLDHEAGCAGWSAYPSDWPKCPACGSPALDGHITCGDVACNEGGRR